MAYFEQRLGEKEVAKKEYTSEFAIVYTLMNTYHLDSNGRGGDEVCDSVDDSPLRGKRVGPNATRTWHLPSTTFGLVEILPSVVDSSIEINKLTVGDCLNLY